MLKVISLMFMVLLVVTGCKTVERRPGQVNNHKQCDGMLDLYAKVNCDKDKFTVKITRDGDGNPTGTVPVDILSCANKRITWTYANILRPGEPEPKFLIIFKSGRHPGRWTRPLKWSREVEKSGNQEYSFKTKRLKGDDCFKYEIHIFGKETLDPVFIFKK